MVRTQIYPTEEERRALAAVAGRTGRTQSELIREAVDRFIARYQEGNRTELLRSARGMWEERDDLPDFEALRRELDEHGVSRTIEERWPSGCSSTPTFSSSIYEVDRKQ